MAGQLDGKVALISGGTSGIGAQTAALFANEGARVVITGRSKEKGQQVADEAGEGVIYCHSDVSNEEDIKASVDFTLAQFGQLNILFNNAGGPTAGEVGDISSDQIDYGVKLLLSSVMLTTRYAVAPMIEAGGGSIINNSSVAGIRYRQGNILYSCLKAAVTHYTKMAGVELGPHNIRVNAISPGAIATPIFWGGSARANTLTDEDNARKLNKLQRNLARATPTPRSGLTDDIAQAALFLASDAGSYVNCHDLVVDGGRTSMFFEPPA